MSNKENQHELAHLSPFNAQVISSEAVWKKNTIEMMIGMNLCFENSGVFNPETERIK